MKLFPRWSYSWKLSEGQDSSNLIPLEANPSGKLKAIICQLTACLRCNTCIVVLMGLLWLLIVAAICYTTQTTSAWPGGKSECIKIATNSALVSNDTKAAEQKMNSTISAQNSTQVITNSTTAREKRGTSLNENPLERREVPKFKFSSWAGKRSQGVEEEKRAKFSSWGGKRADAEDAKRARFSSWGGKRDLDLSGGKSEKSPSWNEPEEVSQEKRAKFNSWAGKRTPETPDDKRTKFSSWAGKRGKFNSWAGKRSDLDVSPEDDRVYFDSWDEQPHDTDHYYLNEDKRATFSSWAGKRNPDYLGTSWSNVTPDNRIKYYSVGMGEPGNENIMKIWQDLMSRKRARFSSWAGKRSEEGRPEHEMPEGLIPYSLPEDKRSKFSSWGGKREDPEKRKFSSWGGKRDVNDSYGETEEDKDGYPSLIVKRSVFTWNTPSVAYKRKPVFSSWGGKRSDIHTIQVRSLPIQRVMVGDRNWGSLMRPIRRGPDFYAWGGKRSA